MPFATNPTDHVRTYFEDSGDKGPPVLFYTGFAGPVEEAKASRLARTLAGEFRIVYADRRGTLTKAGRCWRRGLLDSASGDARDGCGKYWRISR